MDRRDDVASNAKHRSRTLILVLLCFLVADVGVSAFQPITRRACLSTHHRTPLLSHEVLSKLHPASFLARTVRKDQRLSSAETTVETAAAGLSSLEEDDGLSSGLSETGSGWKETVAEIAAIGIPALGSMLIDPIMSLVDTACVGQVSSRQVAAMAPCTSIYQFFFLVFFFLSTTTTNLVAANQDNTEDYNEKVVSCATLLALVCGTVLSGALIAFANPLLTLAGCTKDLLVYARPYLLIRALGLPLVLVATVLQGASLGKQDALTPLKIFLSAGMFNLVGDVFLTLQCGWGVTGAAVATVISQCAAALYYCAKSIRPKKNIVRLRWKGLPDAKLVRQFGVVAVALLLKSITTMGGYSWLTKTTAPMGATALAAHQVTLQVWWLLSYLPEPCNIAAQSLVARDFGKKPFRHVQRMVRVLYASSLLAGVFVSAFTGLALTLPRVVPLIVRDKAVHAVLRTTAGPAMVAQIICSVAALSDGVAVGSGAYGHLPFNSTLAMAVLGLALAGQRSVRGVWVAMWAFMGSRLVGHFMMSRTMRSFFLPSRVEKEEAPSLAVEYASATNGTPS